MIIHVDIDTSELCWWLAELLGQQLWTEQRSWKKRMSALNVDCLRLRKLVTSKCVTDICQFLFHSITSFCCQPVTVVIYTMSGERKCQYIFAHNFAKCLAVIKILSLIDLAVNLNIEPHLMLNIITRYCSAMLKAWWILYKFPAVFSKTILNIGQHLAKLEARKLIACGTLFAVALSSWKVNSPAIWDMMGRNCRNSITSRQ